MKFERLFSRASCALRGLAFCAVLCAPWGSSASAAEPVPELNLIIRAFNDIAFGVEARNLKRRDRLLKWAHQEIPVTFTAFGANDAKGLVPTPVKRAWKFMGLGHLAVLSDLTGIRFFDSIREKKRPLINVIFAPRKLLSKVPVPGASQALLRELAAPGGCYFVAFPGRGGAITRAVVVVNSDRKDELINHCLLEELTQVLGLPNDTDLIRPSIFSDHDHLVELTATDKIMVRTLYDHRLQVGQDPEETSRLARLIISEHLARR